MPHPSEGFINVSHDLWRRVAPTKFKQFLPNMACITMNHSLGDTTKKFMDHDSFVLLRNRIESLLNDMTPEWIHTKIECMATDSIGNGDDLFVAAMFEA